MILFTFSLFILCQCSNCTCMLLLNVCSVNCWVNLISSLLLFILCVQKNWQTLVGFNSAHNFFLEMEQHTICIAFHRRYLFHSQRQHLRDELIFSQDSHHEKEIISWRILPWRVIYAEVTCVLIHGKLAIGIFIVMHADCVFGKKSQKGQFARNWEILVWVLVAAIATQSGKKERKVSFKMPPLAFGGFL